ncbi:hypothetical protein ACWA1C_22885 [Flectobacillus roseus]
MMYFTNVNLRITSLIYLFIPNLIFTGAWFKDIISLPLACLLLLFVFDSIRSELNQDKFSSPITYLPLKDIIVLLLLGIGLCLVFGIGEYRQQTVDWGTNNFKVYDLVNYKWPTYYEKYNTFSSYYWAYYLPTAFLGKLFGIEFCRYIILLWSWIGVFLILMGLYKIGNGLKFVFLFLLFNNGNTLMFLIQMLNIPYLNQFVINSNVRLADFNITFWSPMIASLQWVPQHLIPAGVTTLLILNSENNKNYKLEILVLLCNIIWSPLICIGLLPVVIARYFDKIINPQFYKLIPYFVLMIVPFIPSVLYLISNRAIELSDTNGFIWTKSKFWIEGYVAFWFFNMAVWFFLIKKSLKSSRQKQYLFCALGAFSLLPLYRVGMFNDLLLRGIIPSTFVLGVYVTQQIANLKIQSFKFIAYVCLLCFLSIPSFIRIVEGIRPSSPVTSIAHPFQGEMKNTMDFLKEVYTERALVQYQLQSDSFCEKYLLDTKKD